MMGGKPEVETGKGTDALDRRPKLAAALAQARKGKAAVVVAKLCRARIATRTSSRKIPGESTSARIGITICCSL